jgi:pectate lyase
LVSTTGLVKKILLRVETDQASSKNTKKQTANIQTIKTKTTKTSPLRAPKINTPVTEMKSLQPKKEERKGLETQTVETDKNIGSFNLDNEINKIKIPIPLIELAKNLIYRKQIAKMTSFSENESQDDAINLEDDKTNIIFDPHFKCARDAIAPFYITLTVFDHLLHNYMLDSGASHNVMPK